MNSELIILKIGGDLVSPKTIFRTVNKEKLKEVVRAVKIKYGEGKRFILVHGGGGHAHIPSRCYGLTKMLNKDNMIGLSITKYLLKELNLEITREFIRNNIPVIQFDTCSLLRNDSSIDIYVINEALKANFVPIIHGDITVIDGKSFIVSSDDLVLKLCQHFKPLCAVFVIRERGILDRYGRTIRRISRETILDIADHTDRNYVDVTGGLMKKLDICFKIAKMCRVYICPPDTECLLCCMNGHDCDCCSTIDTSLD